MSVKGGPGQGATFSLSIDALVGRVRTLQLPEWLSEAVDFSGLNDLEWLCFLPANLIDGGTAIAEVYKDTEIAEPTLRIIQECTIELPLQTPASTTLYSITGSGFVTSLARARAVIGEPLLDTITFKFDGNGTDPTVVIESGP